MFKIVLACVLVTICHSQKPYVDPEAGNPKPFTYQYAVADDYSKANFQKTESQDPKGNVKGQFVIALPDGRIQTTSYTANPVQGFVADVSYQGEPVYPKEPSRPNKPSF